MKHIIRIFSLLIMLLIGVTGEAWALSTTDIITEVLPAEAGTEGCTVAVKPIGDDGKTVTITVTPSAGYYVTKENVVAYLLAPTSPTSSPAPRRAVPISDPLEISGDDGIKTGATDYSFVVPEGYAGAKVTVTFTKKGVATAVVKANDLTYNQAAQELVTTTVEGGTVQYQVDATEESGFSASIPTKTTVKREAGDEVTAYKVYYKIVPDAGFSALAFDATKDFVEVKIKPAKLTGVTLDQTYKKVSGTDQTFSVTKLHTPSLIVDNPVLGTDYTIDNNVKSAVGNYEAKVTGKGNLEGVVIAKYEIVENAVVLVTNQTAKTDITALNGHYILTENITDPSIFDNLKTGSFTGTFDGGMFTIGSSTNKLTHPLFAELNNDAKVKNVNLKYVNISEGTNVGAIAGVAKGSSRIYNCGILPVETTYDEKTGKITGFTGNTISGSGDVGSIIGKIEGNARVINCFSYATIEDGDNVAGVVGNLSTTEITQENLATVGMVVNCMFYGEINGGTTIRPVYGGNKIKTDATKGVNPYCFFRADATFNNKTNFNEIDKFNRSWPAEEEYLTRFEYYRSILNSNRKLCTWWVNGTAGTAPTDANVESVGIAKWIVDPSVAPYPILRKWGRYPSITNPNPDKAWNTKTHTWVNRISANEYEGKQLGSLSVTVSNGRSGTDADSKILSISITDMDTLNYDYGYAKIQLPYYNELFGDPTIADDTDEHHLQRYGGNYTDQVVTGWKITAVTGGTDISDKKKTETIGGKEVVIYDHTFTENWESGYNFADRYCTEKDKKRIFAQGGFYYVPEGVTGITIEAKWGKAIYLHNAGHYIDRVNITSLSGNRKTGSPFASAGTLSETYHGQPVYDAWHTAVTKLDEATVSNNVFSKTVYDQAIVLLSNFQLRNENGDVSYTIDSKWHPYTMTSIDQDLDNEPDYCFEFQFRNGFERPEIQPIRFDFLPVPELGLAVRHNQNQNTIGIFIPQGHFEITETSYMHTTQFEYDGGGTKIVSPVILNGGHFEQIVVRKGDNKRTSYFLMGGHFRMLRFTPGRHPNSDNNKKKTRHCAVNAIGGDYPEFYLSGIYNVNVGVDKDNPHCYINGGHFGIIAGAGYEPIDGDVFFKIDHAVINEFYGGGINGSKPITGSIDVTINNSLVNKYCGGPKVGVMGNGKTVSTHASGTIFSRYYGGGNGGTSYYREQKQDGNVDFTNPSTSSYWGKYGYSTFNPLNTISDVTESYEGPDTDLNRGYHALFEFECFVESNGIGGKPTIRSYLHWAQFGTTSTGDITNELSDCKVEGSFYGGGNLANVSGNVTSTLTDCEIKGNAFGGGFSGKIEPFRIHDKSKTEFPYIDNAGIMHNGELYYVKNTDNTDRYYTWCYKNAEGKMFPEGVVIPTTATTDNPTFEYPEGSGNWYVLTTVNLEGLGAVSGSTTLNLVGNTIIGTDTDDASGSVFGGGNESAVDGGTIINVQDGTIKKSVYGGGNKANVGGNTEVHLMGGTINGNVYGGGRGDADHYATVGNTLVKLNEPVVKEGETTYPYNCIVKESIFGCNDVNGTPKGNATVHIYKTAGDKPTKKEDLDDPQDSKHKYQLKAVYGGGNLAAYIPDAADATTHVIIDGCDMTSIQQVYGGGNAASTPATKVEVNGTYEIEELFGGGNGKDPIGEGKPNPGANVGYKDYTKRGDNDVVMVDEHGVPLEKDDATTVALRQQYYQYGTGEANVKIYGGLVHRVFGGSNTLGNVRKTALTLLDGQEDCEFKVDEAYGGGKSAPMDGAAHLEMACIPGLKAAYGGAEEANILNDVTLNITNGTFDRVFGGNNVQGTISGKITVNIEETGCRPIIIGQLYGGGNQAPYTATDGETGPTLNIRSFTSIGDVFGGGYGKTAVVTGNTTVDINVCEGKFFDKETEHDLGNTTIHFTEYERDENGDFVRDENNNRVSKTVDLDIYQPPHTAGEIGAINNVFGGGNAAKVIGNTNVDIGTKIGEEIDIVSLPIKDSENREPSNPQWVKTYEKKEVKGVNIVGNVYGGGNEAEVTGSTNVTIGKKATTTTSSPAPPVTPDPAPTTIPQ